MTTPCSCPGCDQPGTHNCGACKNISYCGPRCQTEDWNHHKEECEGHLLKVGNAHLTKAKGFYNARNHLQALKQGDLALVKLNHINIKKRSLEAISEAMVIKCTALKFLARYSESLQYAKDNYNLLAMARGPAHPKTIDAAFFLIDCLLHCKEWDEAHLLAHTLWEIIHSNNQVDNDVSADQWQEYIARGAHFLSQAIFMLAMNGGIPPEEKKKAGENATARARQSLEINTQLHGAGSFQVATALSAMADVLGFFDPAEDDNEALRLYEQAKVIYIRMEGRASVNVAAIENNIGSVNVAGTENNIGNLFAERANRACDVRDPESNKANLELALPHYREAARVYREINHVDAADALLRRVAEVEGALRQIADRRAASRR